MNSTTNLSPQDQLWSQVTPIVLSGAALIVAALVGWVQKKLHGHVRHSRSRLYELEQGHEALKMQVSQKSESQKSDSPRAQS